jgi:hypothetical protein
MSENTSTTTKQYTDLTPYRAAQIATLQLRKAGKLAADEEIAPQTMYSNKSITRYGSPKAQGGTGVMFVGASFAAWLQAAKSGTGTARVSFNLDRIAAQYDDIDVVAGLEQMASANANAASADDEGVEVADEVVEGDADGDELDELAE